MAKNSKQVALPAAAQNMAQWAVDLPTHLQFDTTLVGEPETASQPTDHVPDQAHVPTDVPPLVTLPDAARHMTDTAEANLLGTHLQFDTTLVGEPETASQPTDHVPDQAHVPTAVPPLVTLPDAARHLSDTAYATLFGSHLQFDTTLVGEPETASQPTDHVPDQAHVPTDVPPLVTLPD